MIAVHAFSEIFSREVVRQVAVDAEGFFSMRAVIPRVKLSVHDVAVSAGFGIGRQVREAVSVVESESADSGGAAEYRGGGGQPSEVR